MTESNLVFKIICSRRKGGCGTVFWVNCPLRVYAPNHLYCPVCASSVLNVVKGREKDKDNDWIEFTGTHEVIGLSSQCNKCGKIFPYGTIWSCCVGTIEIRRRIFTEQTTVE